MLLCLSDARLNGNCSQRDTLPGLEVRLLPHQTIGVAWYIHILCLPTPSDFHSHFRMLKQEHSQYKGGILAYVFVHLIIITSNAYLGLYSDDMGLGARYMIHSIRPSFSDAQQR